MFILFFPLCFLPIGLSYNRLIHWRPALDDPLYPLLPLGEWYRKNRVDFSKHYNWKTGELVDVAKRADLVLTTHIWGSGFFASGFFWEQNIRREDDYPAEEPNGCAPLDRIISHEQPKRIEIGETQKFSNGSVRVSCDRFDGEVRRVSEAISGCFFNETVYKRGEYWTEPIEGSNNGKIMECKKSDNGYFVGKIIGCSYINPENHSENEEIVINTARFIFKENVWKKCVMTEPGQVELVDVDSHKYIQCFHDGIPHDNEYFTDEKRGAILACATRDHGKVHKTQCKINNVELFEGDRVKLSNGCTFVCQLQTNIYTCDSPLEMFKVVGKPRKSTR